jgi:type 1 glutamine amidotransferase
MDGDHPCMWWRNMKTGRCWYTAGGHTIESFADPLFRAHMKQGILWAAKLEKPVKPAAIESKTVQ